MLRLGVAGGEGGQQLAQEHVVAVRTLRRAGGDPALERSARRRDRFALQCADVAGLHPHLLEESRVPDRVGRQRAEDVAAELELLDRLVHPRRPGVRGELAQRRIDRVRELLALVSGRRRIDLGQLRPFLPGAPALGVHSRDHAAQAVRRVGGREVEPRRIARFEELLERAVEGVDRDARGARLVEHLVLGVDAGCERMAAKELRAEAVDRRDPRRLRLARRVVPPEREEPPAYARPQLGCGLFREGDREDPIDRHAVLHDRAHEPFHEHPRLAAPRVRVNEQAGVAVIHRGPLLGCQLEAHSSCLQIEG